LGGNTNADAYQRELTWAHGTEVFGEALYSTAARFTRQASRRRKWQTLAALEMRTKTMVAEALDREGVPAFPSRLQRSLGQITGVLAAVFPWRCTLWVVGVVARSTVARFERFETEAPLKHLPLLQYLTAHERAQCDFVAHELAGDDDSLAEVLNVLKSGCGSTSDP
jgi:hypothetical protein